MGHDRQFRRARWRLPRVAGAAVLTAGVLAVGLPAGTALAAPAPAAPVQTSLGITTSVKALGHTWSLTITAGGGAVGGEVNVSLETTAKGVTEEHTWSSIPAFGATAIKELKATSTGHATWKTGSALSPVLTASVSFAPTKATKQTCLKGSETSYAGKVSGTVTLVTGLRGVKVHVSFSGQPVGALTVDKGCVSKPGKNFCLGGSWFISSTHTQVIGVQLLGTKPPWFDDFGIDPVKTANKWLNRGSAVLVNGLAPKLNTTAKTVTVGGLTSGGLTGTAVISYKNTVAEPPQTCLVGIKKFKATETVYLGAGVKITKPFQAHTLLAGTLTLKTASTGTYSAVKLSAA
jgi:hypothetical protein